VKSIEQEEELDKHNLNHLCSDIMEEVMGMGGWKNDLLIILGSKSRKKKTNQTRKINTRL
jgi:hypothetical protein